MPDNLLAPLNYTRVYDLNLELQADVEVEAVGGGLGFAVTEIYGSEGSIDGNCRTITTAEILDADIFVIVKNITPVKITQQVKTPGEFETQL